MADYNAETRQIELAKYDTNIRLAVGSNIIECNGTAMTMDTEAVIVNDRTFIPLRYLAQAVGCDVEYE